MLNKQSQVLVCRALIWGSHISCTLKIGMKGLIVKGSSLTYQGERLNGIIYSKIVMSQAKNFKNPVKPKKNNKTPKKHRFG
jgi:hypothetical protein